MMRIAVASEGKNVTEHFGHCEGFLIYDAENGEILKEEMVLNPGHKPGFLPNFLSNAFAVSSAFCASVRSSSERPFAICPSFFFFSGIIFFFISLCLKYLLLL